jgi:hypothetical protein
MWLGFRYLGLVERLLVDVRAAAVFVWEFTQREFRLVNGFGPVNLD